MKSGERLTSSSFIPCGSEFKLPFVNKTPISKILTGLVLDDVDANVEALETPAPSDSDWESSDSGES